MLPFNVVLFFYLFCSVRVGSGDKHCESESLLCPISGRSKRNYDPFQEDQLLLLSGKFLLYLQGCSGDRCTCFLTLHCGHLITQTPKIEMSKMLFKMCISSIN